MSRQLFVTLFLAVVIPPASAQPVICYPYPPPPPLVICAPIVACLPCPLATAVVAPSTPVVIPERMQEQPKQEPKKMTQSEPLNQPREFATPTAIDPKSESKIEPKVVTPASGTGDRIPAIDVPMTPAKTEPVVKPPVTLPKFEFTPPPPTDTPKPADPLPPLDVPLPKSDDKPKADEKPKSTATGLPKFDLDFPKTDLAQPVEANKPTVAKSSPLSNERRPVFDVYPVDGPAPASPTAKRTVGFVNKSDRDLLLTIDGKMVTLPTKNVLRAELPASFKWQIGGEIERELQVPTTAPGVDVVIRR